MRSLIRLTIAVLLAFSLISLYNSPQYHQEFQGLWQQVVSKFNGLQEQISSEVGYGPVSNLSPKKVGVEVPRSEITDWQSVGTLGPAILGGSRSLKIEIDYTPASAPSASDEAVLSSVLGHYSGKQVSIVPDEGNLPVEKDYSLDTVVKLTEEHRSCFTSSTQVCLYFLFLPGSFENSAALGAAYTSSAVAIMTEQIQNGSNALVSRDRIATATITHELGHLFGLVNLIGKEVRPHEDPDHPGHSSNPNSVMYWAVEDLSVNSILSGGPVTTFDQDDEADIALIRGNK